MGKKVIVAGAGHGGLVAGLRLAKKGYAVTVYERAAQESDLGYPWEDFFDVNTFRDADLPMPAVGKIPKVPISFYGPNPEDAPIRQTVQPDEYEMHMYRKDLYAHLMALVKESGVEVVYGCEIQKPLMLGNRVVGIGTNLGDFTADLVIDACGVDSPLRTQMPDYLGIQNELQKYDFFYTYRAYFNRLEGFEDVKNEYKVYFVDDGKKGLSWAVTTDDTVDLLIGRFKPFGEDEIAKMHKVFKNDNPHLGDQLICGGKICKIPVRQPIAVLVADGYAAVGDSACMTVPIVGSGIANSIRAGVMLADAVLADANDEFSAQTLWAYQKAYYENIGESMAIVDLIKIFLTRVTKADFEFFFGKGILTSEDLSINSNETSVKAMFSNFSPSIIVDRLKKVGGNPELLRKVGSVAVNVGKLKLVMTRFPDTYEREAILKWAKKYNKFFQSLIEE